MRLRDQLAEPPRPGLREILPFGVLVAAGVLPAMFAITPGKGWLVVWVWVGLLASSAIQVVSQRRPSRSWVDPVPAWLFFLTWSLLRDATGGPLSSAAALIVVPILWLALFGTRRDLAVSAVLTFAAFSLPHLLDPASYPTGDLRRAVLWTGFVLLVAPVVQRLVNQLTVQSAREQRTAAQLRGVLQGATLSSLITTDLDGIVTSVNQGAVEILGYRAEEVVGRHVTTLHDPDEIAATAAELDVEDDGTVLAHLAHARSPSRIWRYVRKDGTHRFVRLAMTVLRDDHDHVTGYLGVGIDATSAQQANQALAAAEQRWRLAMDNLPDLTVLVLDADLHVSLVAGAGAMRQGLAGSVGRSLKSHSSATNVELISSGVHRALETGLAEVELLSTKQGMEHHVVFVALPHGDGERVEVLTLARDVSAERARERVVAAARDRAESLLTSATHGVAVITREAVIEQVNPALCRLLQQTEAELVGTTLTAAPGPDATALAEHLAALVTHGPGDQAVHAEWDIDRAGSGHTHLSVGSTVIVGPEDDQILMTFTDLSERHQTEQELSWLAEHDPLTGLTNRRRFERALSQHLVACRSSQSRGALLMIDLDHFKAVNDTEGHSVGDQVLVSVAETLLAAVRSTDVVARLGGDEFAVLLPDADGLGAEVVAEHVVAQIRACVGSGPHGHGVTASVGIVLIDAEKLDPEAVLATADLTMYDAKNGGRDRWVTLGSRAAQGTTRSPDRRSWSAQLQRAIRDDELVLHLQPIWHVASSRVAAADAIVRMRDGDRLVEQKEFLAHIERTDLVRELDRWMIDRGLQTLARIHEVDPTYHLGIVISGASLDDPQLESTLVSALARHRITDPSMLTIAISETRATSDPQAARALVGRITTIGCRLALNDFGVGFASLTYLRQLPFAYVRIDSSFVAGSTTSPADLAIVTSTVELSHRLDKSVLAAGVDDAATFELMAAGGVDSLEGEHIGSAVPVEEYLALRGLVQDVPARS